MHDIKVYKITNKSIPIYIPMAPLGGPFPQMLRNYFLLRIIKIHIILYIQTF